MSTSFSTFRRAAVSLQRAGRWLRNSLPSTSLVVAGLAFTGFGFGAAASRAATTGGESPFGLDYRKPDQYLAQGRQTQLTPAELAELGPAILPRLSGRPAGLEQLAGLFEWLRGDFESWNAGGSTIGEATARELLLSKRLGGCHDFALVFAAITRVLGYPAVMVDTAGIDWIKNSTAGAKGPYTGHVFVEVYVDGRWILVDATNGTFVADGYDPGNPAIPLGKGYYVMCKGADTWGYGINSNQQLQQLMNETAQRLQGVALAMPEYEVRRWKAAAAPPLGANRVAAEQSWPSRGKPELYANGKIKSCVLAGETSIGNVLLPAGTSISFSRSGIPEECTLGKAANVRGFMFPAGTRVRFGPQGRPAHCALPQDTIFHGVTLPAKSEIFFGNPYFGDPAAEGHPNRWRCWFPEKTRVQGHLCGATTDGVGQIFYRSGQLRAIWLQEVEEIDGVPCTSQTSGMPLRVRFYGTDRMVCFHESGRLQQALVARDCTIQGQRFKAGDIIRFTPDGALDPVTTTLRGKSRVGQ